MLIYQNLTVWDCFTKLMKKIHRKFSTLKFLNKSNKNLQVPLKSNRFATTIKKIVLILLIVKFTFHTKLIVNPAINLNMKVNLVRNKSLDELLIKFLSNPKLWEATKIQIWFSRNKKVQEFWEKTQTHPVLWKIYIRTLNMIHLQSRKLYKYHHHLHSLVSFYQTKAKLNKLKKSFNLIK